ncbi:4a-hydroxytetrahydrobiopterin dehydratase [Candidatus Saccharibacteria bacterium]|nr:4a-hydroxytetrahydrobiopterin dehydratase [Candidatus Saccharibacteria bacterium]
MSWQEKNSSLYKKFEFKDFKQAFEFMKQVAEVAEEQNHHPKWLNEYNKVEIWLSTHSEGKITDKDHTLAKEIDKIYEDLKV